MTAPALGVRYARGVEPSRTRRGRREGRAPDSTGSAGRRRETSWRTRGKATFRSRHPGPTAPSLRGSVRDIRAGQAARTRFEPRGARTGCGPRRSSARTRSPRTSAIGYRLSAIMRHGSRRAATRSVRQTSVKGDADRTDSKDRDGSLRARESRSRNESPPAWRGQSIPDSPIRPFPPHPRHRSSDWAATRHYRRAAVCGPSRVRRSRVLRVRSMAR